MEKSALADNAITFLHDENYLDRFSSPIIGVDSWLKVTGRPAISLDGHWGFAIDPFDTGFRQRWFDQQPAAVPATADWNPKEAETCPVPSVWNLHRPELFHYEGGVWYAREIRDPRTNRNQRLILRFGAANYCARVFLNGAFLGMHLGGSTPFCIDISDRIGDGAADLMVHVENRRDPARVPCHHFDWFNYGGMHREVALYVLPAGYIRDWFIRYEGDGRILVDIETTEDLTEAHCEIPELGLRGSAVLSEGRGRLAIEARPELWSPGLPRLYDVVLRAGDDRLVERIGFRTISIAANRIAINGQPLFLKGICAHEDDRDSGRVTSEPDIRRRFAHARELGANFLRLAHYPHHERAAEIADEEGLLLWEELPAYWSVDFDNPATFVDADNQLAELIRRDRNRASIIMWSLANETADTDSRNVFIRRLAETARKLDPTRLLTAACLFNQETLTVEDRLVELLDVVGINEYFGWYDCDVSNLKRVLDAYEADKPLVISETGCDITVGDAGPASQPNSEAFGVQYFNDQVAVVEDHPAVAGFMPWLLYDFRTERRQNPAQRGWNRKGLISGDKSTHKSAFDVIAAFYRRI